LIEWIVFKKDYGISEHRRTMYFGRTGAGITAMAAVDMALWDLKGKFFQQPIHCLLDGKQHSSIQAYASILHWLSTCRDAFCLKTAS
jgi:L-alanine-DL-glutamate epimerase-like enolase superfamily enzyme